jgi:hypothetical protein
MLRPVGSIGGLAFCTTARSIAGGILAIMHLGTGRLAANRVGILPRRCRFVERLEGEDAMPYVQKFFGDSEASRELVIVSTEGKNELDTLRPACEHRSNDLSVYLWSLSCWMKAFVQK